MFKNKIKIELSYYCCLLILFVLKMIISELKFFFFAKLWFVYEKENDSIPLFSNN